jgi:hypothetical protein
MRLALVVLGIVLSASSCFAQGEILDKGQNAFFVQGGIFSADDITAGGGGAGYSFLGTYDLSTAVIRCAREGRSAITICSVAADEHVLRYSIARKSTLILSLHQALQLQTSSPERESSNIGDLGVSGTYKLSPGPGTKILLSAGYVRSFVMDGAGTGLGALLIDGTFAFHPGSDRMYMSLTPSVSIQEDLTVFGLTFSLAFLRSS